MAGGVLSGSGVLVAPSRHHILFKLRQSGLEALIKVWNQGYLFSGGVRERCPRDAAHVWQRDGRRAQPRPPGATLHERERHQFLWDIGEPAKISSGLPGQRLYKGPDELFTLLLAEYPPNTPTAIHSHEGWVSPAPTWQDSSCICYACPNGLGYRRIGIHADALD